eukprot:TRINITY_DN6168_c0_g1_i1.p1 TRINITY_DN6168_c0_g1~~TRINITY_DN6168_c0_g1_i1.p1  ORF type:complete len:221 (-),score=42.04 TRINITY_DN6168_c0_g1_i1:82-744(-)
MDQYHRQITSRINSLEDPLKSQLHLYFTTFYLSQQSSPSYSMEHQQPHGLEGGGGDTGESQKIAKICGVPNKYGKPCSRTGKCPFHGDATQAFCLKKEKVVKRKHGWKKNEHLRFLKGLQLHGRCWKAIEREVGSKTAGQIQAHANRYFARQSQTEKKRKSIHDFDLNLLEEIEAVFAHILSSISMTEEGFTDSDTGISLTLVGRIDEQTNMIDPQSVTM